MPDVNWFALHRLESRLNVLKFGGVKEAPPLPLSPSDLRMVMTAYTRNMCEHSAAEGLRPSVGERLPGIMNDAIQTILSPLLRQIGVQVNLLWRVTDSSVFVDIQDALSGHVTDRVSINVGTTPGSGITSKDMICVLIS